MSDVMGVDPDIGHIQPPRQSQRPVDVLGPDRAPEPVGRVISDGEGLLLIPKGMDEEHRPEDLLPRHPPIHRRAHQHRGRQEERGLILGNAANRGLGPLGEAEADIGDRLVILLARRHRAHQHLGIQRIAHGQALRALDHALDHLVMQPFVDHEPRAGGAGLAAIHEGAIGHGIEAALEIGVIADDGGKLAAAFQRDLGQALGRPLHDPHPRRRAAGEGDLVDAGMIDQRIARGLPRPAQQIHDAGRKGAAVMHRLDQRRRGGRRHLGGFDHRGAARGQRGAQLAHRQIHRIVPGNDERRHPRRLRQDHVPELRRRRSRHMAFEEARGPGEIAQLVHRTFDLAGHVHPYGLAHLAGDQLADGPRALLQNIRQLQQGRGAHRSLGPAPAAFVEGTPRRRHRARHLGRTARRCSGQRLARGRVEALEAGPAAGDPFPVDVVLDLDHAAAPSESRMAPARMSMPA